MALMFAAYHQVTPRMETVEVYETMLSDLDFKECRDAVFQLIKTSKWLPTIAEIRGLVVPPPRQLSAPYHRYFGATDVALPRRLTAPVAKPMFDPHEAQRKAEEEQQRQRRLADELLEKEKAS
jgi:hypothetical protein